MDIVTIIVAAILVVALLGITGVLILTIVHYCYSIRNQQIPTQVTTPPINDTTTTLVETNV